MVIPTLNGGARFRACLQALSAQRPPADDLVVIDSGSTDGTPEAAEAAGATLLRRTPDAFDHGRTRNEGVAALGPVDVIVFLVQDAVPRREDFLSVLTRAALRTGVGAATAAQVPAQDADALTRSTVSASPFARTEPRTLGPFAPEQLAALRPRQWRARLLLDDVACALRARPFRAVGFRPTPHGEDALLAYDLLWAGWALAHEPAAVVEHGHAYGPATVVARYRDDAAFFRERFGLRVRPGPWSVFKGLAAELRRDLGFLRPWRDPAGLARALRLRWAQLRAQRAGSRGPLGELPEPRPVPPPREAGT